MKRFCKLFETEDFGQVLVKIDTGDEGDPEVRVYCEPPNLGVCASAMTFNDTDRGWDDAERYFESMDLDRALPHVRHLFSIGQGLTH